MPCERYELLNRFHDGDLLPAEAVEFRKHLQTCPDCRSELHQLQESESQVRNVVRQTVPAGGLAEKVLRRIQQEKILIARPESSTSGDARFGTWNILLKWAVPVLAIFLLVVILRIRTAPVTQVPPEPSMIISACALSDQESIGQVKLPAQSQHPVSVDALLKIREKMAFSWLDGRQRLEITGSAVVRLDTQRLLWEDGDAEIAFTLASPIMVRVGMGELMITGTRIHLRGRAVDRVVVTLLEGHVRYHTPEGDGELVPGNPMVFAKNGCYPEGEQAKPTSTSIPVTQPFVSPLVSPVTPGTSSQTAAPDRISPFEGTPVEIPQDHK